MKAIKSVVDIEKADNVDLKLIKVLKKQGGTIDDTMLFKGVLFANKSPIAGPGVPSKITNPKVAMI